MSSEDSKDGLRPQTWAQGHGITIMALVFGALFVLVIVVQMLK